jgi:hypothetical protein
MDREALIKSLNARGYGVSNVEEPDEETPSSNIDRDTLIKSLKSRGYGGSQPSTEPGAWSKAKDWLSEIFRTTENEAESQDDLTDTPVEPKKSLLRRVAEGVGGDIKERVTSDIPKGVVSAAGSVYDLGAGLATLAEKAAGSGNDPLSALITKSKDYLREKSIGQSLLRKQMEEQQPTSDITHGMTESAANMAVSLPKYALLSAVPGGAVAGFGAEGALGSAGRGGSIEDIIKEGAGGATMGAAFKGVHGMPRPVRIPVLGGTMGAMTAAQGGDPKQIAQSGIEGAVMGLLGGKGERKIGEELKALKATPTKEANQKSPKSAPKIDAEKTPYTVVDKNKPLEATETLDQAQDLVEGKQPKPKIGSKLLKKTKQEKKATVDPDHDQEPLTIETRTTPEGLSQVVETTTKKKGVPTNIVAETPEAAMKVAAETFKNAEFKPLMKPKVEAVATKPDTPLHAEARKYKSAEEFVENVSPDAIKSSGYYITGLTHKGEIDTGRPMWASHDINQARYYTNKGKGRIILSKPKNGSKILDTTNETELSKFIDEINNLENEGAYNFAHTVGEAKKYQPMDELINPPDIVEEGGLWDNPQFMQDVSEHFGYDFVETRDGGIYLNPESADTNSQLTSIWNEANKGEKPAKVQVAEKVFEPVEKIGARLLKKGKVAKASEDINVRMIEAGFEELSPDEKARYTPTTKKATLAKVEKVLKNYDKAKSMLRGEVVIPQGVDKQVLYNAVKNHAFEKGDVDVMRDLAKSPIAEERSLLAQKLGASGFNNDPYNAVDVMQQVNKAKQKKYADKHGSVEKAIDKEVQNLEKQIRKTQPKVKDWTSFIDSIKC